MQAPMSEPNSSVEVAEVANPAEPESQPESQPESESDSDSDCEDFSDAPSMQEYINAKNALQEMNGERKDLLDTMKRKREEMEDYMIGKDAKFLRIEGMVIQFKKTKKISWNEKALREHVDDDGKIDIDAYKTNQTVLVEKMSIKIE